MSVSPPVLRSLDDPRDPRWDAYVRAHARGSFFHLLGWRRVIERAFPHRPHYLYVERDDRVVGLLPLFEVGGAPFTRALVSVPVGVGGGVLADEDESARMLKDGARVIAERERLAYVEYKSEHALFPELSTKRDLYFTFRQQILADPAAQLELIPRKTRAVLRTAFAARLRGELSRENLDVFCDLYALSLRNLGTPMFPRELFQAFLEEFEPHEVDLLFAREAGRIIGAVMNFYFRDTILPFFAGTVPEARDVGVNNFLYWHLLETGHARGYRWFDFGRSKADTGPFHFKRHFGMEPVPLEYQYDLVSAQELPNVNPTNPKYAKAIELWKQLPVDLTKLVGPWVHRRLP